MEWHSLTVAWLRTDCRYSPIGVFFLILQEIVKMVDPFETFAEVAFYTLTVAIGLVLHGYGILPLIYWVFVRKNPLTFVRGMLPAIMTALATASRLALWVNTRLHPVHPFVPCTHLDFAL